MQTLRKDVLPPSSRTFFDPEEGEEVACPFDVSAYLKYMTSEPPKPQYLPSPRVLNHAIGADGIGPLRNKASCREDV
jgi:hypothetical protein